MAQQTAFQWFIEQLKRYGYYGEDFIFTGIISSELIEQAKQMEKEQICDALDFGKVCLLQSNYKSAEQYYNETFGRPINDSENSQNI